MSRYIPFTEEEKYIAHHSDIKAYLESIGEKVLKSGTEFMWAKHDSVKFRGHVYYRHSEDDGGDIVKFLMTFFDFSYQEAVITLLDGKYMAGKHTTALNAARAYSPYHPKTANIVLPKKNKNNNRLYAYLCQYRKIDPSVVKYFVNQHLIYETEEKRNDKTFHNICYIGKDGRGVIRYAGIKGTFSNNSFSGDVYNSKKEYCFRHIGTSNVLFVCEAFIDIFSYITLYQLDEPWKTYNYIALAGLSLDVLKAFLKSNRHIKTIVICTDNDYNSSDGVNHGQRFATQAKDSLSTSYRVRIDTPYKKDWNEILMEDCKNE